MVYLMFEVAVVYSVIVACSSRCVKPPGLRKPVRVEVDKDDIAAATKNR